ncbi:MAG: 3-deoxy-D-manno-octulosonic acid kinase [Gammaproteobacteria bacterium]|nr:3-deoxy-D-manno-octulosonic acid kinase [Gammaproteobacteria bacterium]
MSFNQHIIKQSESIAHQFRANDFDLSYWRPKKDTVELAGGRGASQKILIDEKFYVLRHYLRGGFVAHFLHDQYFWTGLNKTRPFLEQKAIEQALLHNLPVPEVVAFNVQKQGLFYRASIISRYINNQGTLASFLYNNEMSDKLWTELGKLIKRLHQANIFHADLNANNILIDETGKFYIIDFDKAEIISSMAVSAEKNVHRLLRSLTKIQNSRQERNLSFYFDSSQWQFLLDGYDVEN